MKNRKWASLILCAGLLLSGTCWASSQDHAATCSTDYVNHNQAEPAPLKVGAVAGVATDDSGAVVPGACFLLFTEVNHSLVATFVSGADGTFNFQQVPPGRYRLVVKYGGFCAANVPLKVVNKPAQKAKIAVHLRHTGLDSCSSGDLTS